LAAVVKQEERRPVGTSPRVITPNNSETGPRELFERGTEELTRNFDGVLAGESEAIHQFRISVRKLRALLELYQAVLEQGWLNRHREELRFFGHSVGGLRDSDVLQQNLKDAAGRLDDPLRDALAPLHETLSERRRHQHELAAALLRSSRYEALVQSLSAAAFKQALSPDDRTARPELIKPLVHTVERAGARLTRHSSPTEFHRLRIRIKRLRYALETLGEGQSKQAKRATKKLKSAQEILGIQHDLITAMGWLREVASSVSFPGPSLLAAGAVYHVLYRRNVKLSRRAWKNCKSLRAGATLHDIAELPEKVSTSAESHKSAESQKVEAA
jgi:CHAD domain-containing protein